MTAFQSFLRRCIGKMFLDHVAYPTLQLYRLGTTLNTRKGRQRSSSAFSMPYAHRFYFNLFPVFVV